MIHVKCVAQGLTEASVQLKVAIFMKQIEPSKSQRIWKQTHLVLNSYCYLPAAPSWLSYLCSLSLSFLSYKVKRILFIILQGLAEEV